MTNEPPFLSTRLISASPIFLAVSVSSYMACEQVTQSKQLSANGSTNTAARPVYGQADAPGIGIDDGASVNATVLCVIPPLVNGEISSLICGEMGSGTLLLHL